ncbi:MAG: acyltransferase family protein [Gammaproteobacteria bacterium]|nr:acyltransferase family protein [Gammaproteobacteria bacterium]
MSAPERLHALDAVRAFALLLGIVLHATMTFFMPLHVTDSSQSEALGVTFFVIHIFRMSLFFLIAGFFAHMLVQRRGFKAFVGNRAKRIVVPMIAGWVVFAPLTIGAMIWGAVKMNGPGALDAPQQSTGFPLIHLWFLYYLCLLYVIVLGLRAAVDAAAGARAKTLRRAVDGAVRALTLAPLAPLVLAAPLALVLVLDESWIPWGGIPTPDQGFMPRVPALVGFGSAFVFGWLLHRQLDLLHEFRRRWPWLLTFAVALSAACLWIVGSPGQGDPLMAGVPAWVRAVYAACYTTSSWCWAFGIVGAALRLFSRPSPVARYVADSSYWLYLAHLPLVFFLQAVVADWPLHWSVKFPLIVTAALTVLLASYHYVVRPTFIGEVLNGRRYPRRRRRDVPVSMDSPRPMHPEPPRWPRPTLSEPAHREPSPSPRLVHSPGPPQPMSPPGEGGRHPEHVAELANVTMRFGTTTALDAVSLAVRPGELLALLGPNGAGKTTAISLWLGMLEPDEGSVTLMGRSPLEVANRRNVGVMMQDVQLAPALRARELIELTASYYPHPYSLEETLALTRTTALASKRYGSLSGGQKRQIQFATAVCARPQLLFLDEPTVGLDVEAREMLWRTIRDLLSNGTSIVLTTHYLEEAEALADRVAVLARGRLVATGTVDEMRSLVARRRITCTSALDVEVIRSWPGVIDAVRDAQTVEITAFEAENVVRRLLEADASVGRLEVRQASLAEAFNEITKEAA